MILRWDEDKNQLLRETRNISFEDVELAISEGKILHIGEHGNKEKYPNQYVLIIDINDYAFIVPFVFEDDNTIFLKTIIPSRKETKKYFGG